MFKPHGAHRARMLGVAALSVCTALLGTPATLAAPAPTRRDQKQHPAVLGMI